MKRSKFGVSRHFPENAWRKWPEILDDDVSWPPSELISLWPWSVDFYASPLGAGGIMFLGCLSVRLSVRSLKYPLLTCTWIRWSTRPTVTVLQHVRPSVRPSGEVSGHLPENAWREWPEILHADVSWPSSELISLWPWSVDFSNFGTSETGQIWGFRAFPGERMEEMAWNFAHWCILTTFRTD